MDNDTRKILAPLCAPFFAEGAERLFAHDCCGWIVVALVAQAECRECKRRPDPVVVTPADLESPA